MLGVTDPRRVPLLGGYPTERQYGGGTGPGQRRTLSGAASESMGGMTQAVGSSVRTGGTAPIPDRSPTDQVER